MIRTYGRPPGHSAVKWWSFARPGRVIALVLSLILAFVGTVGLSIYHDIFGSVKSVKVTIDPRIDATDGSKTELPSDLNAGKPLNILLIGTDSREGANAAIGGIAEGVRSDTTIVVHISADRKTVRMASIPRDLIIPATLMSSVSACGDITDSTTYGGGYVQFNTAFSNGYGPTEDTGGAVSCIMGTVTNTAGVNADGAAVLDFTAFVNVVNALNGVQICGANDFSPEMVNLHLSPGCHTLTGEQAIEFVRARHVGDGTDLQRIERQQCFLRTVTREMLNGGMFSQATQTLSVAKSLAQHMTMTENLTSAKTLASLLYSLREINPSKIESWKAPVEPWSIDPNRVVWGYGAEQFWKDFINDSSKFATHNTAQAGSTLTSDAEQKHTDPLPADNHNDVSTSTDTSTLDGPGSHQLSSEAKDGESIASSDGQENCY